MGVFFFRGKCGQIVAPIIADTSFFRSGIIPKSEACWINVAVNLVLDNPVLAAKKSSWPFTAADRR
jgi:hypothetical protein